MLAARGRTLLLAAPAAMLVALAAVLWTVTRTIGAEVGRELAEERIHIERVQAVERAAAAGRAAASDRCIADVADGEEAGERIVEATNRLRAAVDELGQLRPIDARERASAMRLIRASAMLSNDLMKATFAADARAQAAELSQDMDTVDAHARATSAIASEAGSSTDARLERLRARQTLVQVAFILVALTILFIAVGLSRRQLRASEEMRLLQERSAGQRARFFANMSHELRTPLVAIRGFASMITSSEGVSEGARDDAHHIETQAADLLSIINNILDAAKLEAGRVDLDIEDVDALEVLERCLNRCRGLCSDKDVELRCEVPAALRVRADFVKTQQVFTNLIGNAIKFTERGTVTVRARADGHLVEIDVEDTGVGIEPAALTAIWEPFQQASGSVNRQFGGTGLGLSIVRSLVEMMGGEVRVRSTWGEGSTFTVQLPAAGAAEPNRDAVPPEPSS